MKNKTGQKLKIITPCNYNSVRLTGTIINKLCRELFSEESDIAPLELAVVEACNNVIEHAHKEKPDEDLTIKIFLDDNKIEFHVYDKGEGTEIFNADGKTLANIAPLSESSRGVPIIKNIMDKAEYKRYKKHNVLKMIKYKKQK